MESMVVSRLSATLADLPPPPIGAPSLAAAFTLVPDPRRQASVTYPLAALLSLAVAALLANHTSVLAIAEWGRRQRRAVLTELGFPEGGAPCQSTMQRLVRRLDPDAVSAALSAALAPAAPPPAARGAQGVAIDGKAQRGRLQYEAGGSPVHALTAFAHDRGVVLAQEPIGRGATKAEAELTVAPALLARVDWRGRVLTGDALFGQRTLGRQVLDAGGDYLLLVKATQPALHWAIARLFDPAPGTPPPPPLLDRREARTVERGHGRQDEVRHLVATTALTGYLDWPGAAQVVRVERTWREQGQLKRQVRDGLTSLPPEDGTAARLLALKRGHWQIENRLHRPKDVTLGEDASLVHSGQGPTVLAMLRDAAVSLLHRAGVRALAARLRDHSQHPEPAVALVCEPPPAHA